MAFNNAYQETVKAFNFNVSNVPFDLIQNGDCAGGVSSKLRKSLSYLLSINKLVDSFNLELL